MPGFVRFTQVEADPLGMRLVKSFHQVECALAQRLTNRVKEYEDEVATVGKPYDGLVHVERIFHVPIHKA